MGREGQRPLRSRCSAPEGALPGHGGRQSPRDAEGETRGSRSPTSQAQGEMLKTEDKEEGFSARLRGRRRKPRPTCVLRHAPRLCLPAPSGAQPLPSAAGCPPLRSFSYRRPQTHAVPTAGPPTYSSAPRARRPGWGGSSPSSACTCPASPQLLPQEATPSGSGSLWNRLRARQGRVCTPGA